MTECRTFSPDLLGTEESLECPDERAVVLLDGFQSLRFGYYLYDGTEVMGDPQPTWDSLEQETLPIAVQVTVEGLVGADSTWVQEIPIMAASYGEGAGEVDDEDCGDLLEDVDEDDDDEGPGTSQGRELDDDDEGDDEEDEE
jgi:hypothetical protein